MAQIHQKNASKQEQEEAGNEPAGDEAVADKIRNAADSAAANVREAADALVHDTDLNELLSAVADYGRKKPLTLLATGIVAGLVLGRIFGGSSNRS